jgi:hypothetical protein
LWSSTLIPGTDIYVETHLNASSLVKLGYQLIEQFDYPQEALEIEVES